jgi:hypothetical protein
MMREKQIVLLKLLLDATRDGRAIWRQDGGKVHRTELAGVECSFRFKYSLLADESGSDADGAELSIGGTVWAAYSGSEEFDLVGEILSVAYPEIGEHNREVKKRLDEAIDRIRQDGKEV